MTTIIPDLVDHVEEQEEEEEEASDWQLGSESEDGGTGTQVVRVINTKVYEDMLTVAEFQELEAEDGDPHCTRKIFMDMWAVYLEHGVEVTRYRVLATTVTESEVVVADPTLQDLINHAYPGDPHPPNVIHILADYPDLEEESAGGTGGKGKGKSDKGKGKSEDRGQHDADGKGTGKSDKGKGKSEDRGQHDADGEKTEAEEEDEKKAEAEAEERRMRNYEYEYDEDIEVLLATHAAKKRSRMAEL
jgi:hypothetical protein